MILNQNLCNIASSGIRRIGQIASAVSGCIALTIGEPDLDAPVSVREKISAAILNGDTHYPPNAGIPALRKEAADAVNRRFGTGYKLENTVITVGSTEALASAFLAILNPGDEVIIPVPAFSLYQSQVEMLGGTPVPLDISKSGYQITRGMLSGVLSERTKAICFASPNNPTGTILSEESLSVIAEAALSHDLFIIDDSVYDQIVYTDHVPTLMKNPDLTDRLIYINAFSKTYAMTGVRVGYAVADTAVMAEMIKAHSYLTVSAPGFIQSGCLSIFDISNVDSVQLYLKRRNIVCHALDKMHLIYPEPNGAFYIFPSIESFGIPDEEFCMRMIHEAGLALVPSSCFGVPGHIRISYCYDDATLLEGMDRLSSFISTLRK